MKRIRMAMPLGAIGIAMFAVWLGAVRPVHAQRGGRGGRGGSAPPSPVLALVTSLNCVFPASSVATWESGEPKVLVTNASTGLTLIVTNIDAQEGTAQIAGAGAPRDVTVRLLGSNLHILDIRPDGALTITTVFAQESHDGRYKAVHSQVPDVSQYYGDCEVGPR